MNMQYEWATPFGSYQIVKSLIYKLEFDYPCVEFSYDSRRKRIIGVPRTEMGEIDEGAIDAAISEFSEPLKAVGSRIKEKPVFVHHRAGDPISTERVGALFDAVKCNGVPGTYVLSDEVVSVIKALDEVFAHFAHTLGGVEIQIPSLVRKDDLRKCGYLEKDAHQIATLSVDDGMAGPDSVCLSPAACLPFYPSLNNKTVFTGVPVVYTGLSKVFRWEGGNFSRDMPFSRMWEYMVREIVVFGDRGNVGDVKERYVDFIRAVAQRLDLESELVNAADMFFTRAHSPAAVHQLMTDAKLEYSYVFGSGSRCALSSFNSHGKNFTDAFDIKGECDDFQSCCIGFGLERWSQILLASTDDRTGFLEAIKGLGEIV